MYWNPVDFSGDTIAALLTKKAYLKETAYPAVRMIDIEDLTREMPADEYVHGSGSTGPDEVMKLTRDRTENDGLYLSTLFGHSWHI